MSRQFMLNVSGPSTCESGAAIYHNTARGNYTIEFTIDGRARPDFAEDVPYLALAIFAARRRLCDLALMGEGAQ